MTDEQRDIEHRAGQIIRAAASLTPGVPGHASKIAKLVKEMRVLIREAQVAVRPVVPMQEELPSPTGRAGQPGQPALQSIDPRELTRLQEKYAPPGRDH